MITSIAPIRQVRPETTDDVVRAAGLAFRPYIRKAARMLAPQDRPLRQDLEQEALILLWELDPTRFDGEDRGFIRKAIWRRMRRYVEQEMRANGGGRRIGGSL